MKKNFLYVAFLVLAILISGCASTKTKISKGTEERQLAADDPSKNPTLCQNKSWWGKNPFFASDDVLEAKGVASNLPNIGNMRAIASEIAEKNLSKSIKTSVVTFSESYNRLFRDSANPQNTSSTLLNERDTFTVSQEVLEKAKKDECKDNINNDYRVFMYIKTATVEKITTEKAKQKKEEIATVHRNEFLNRMNERLKQLKDKEKKTDDSL